MDSLIRNDYAVIEAAASHHREYDILAGAAKKTLLKCRWPKVLNKKCLTL